VPAGRYVGHFWKLLTELEIPHATLLDLDLGRVHGGPMTIIRIVEQLRDNGNDLSENLFVELGAVNLAEINDLDDEELLDGYETNSWFRR
jgi:hypothetical protein